MRIAPITRNGNIMLKSEIVINRMARYKQLIRYYADIFRHNITPYT